MKKFFIKNFYLSLSILSCLLIGDALFLYVWYLASFIKDFLIFIIMYSIFFLVLYVVLLLPKVQIDQESITFFVRNHISKKISRDKIGSIEIRGTTFYAILDTEGCVMCFLDRRKEIKKCLEMYNIDIVKR